MSARRVLSAKKQQVYLQFDEVRLRIMSNSKLSRDYFEIKKNKVFNFLISLKLIPINIALISLPLNNCLITLSYRCYKVNYISTCS